MSTFSSAFIHRLLQTYEGVTVLKGQGLLWAFQWAEQLGPPTAIACRPWLGQTVVKDGAALLSEPWRGTSSLSHY